MTDITTCVDINGNTYEIPTAELRWRPAAYGIVIKDGKVLLSKQFGDKYDLPGGGIDLGEDLEAGVLREIKEETGIDAENPRIISVENSFFHAAHASKESYHSILIYYACDYVGGKLSTDGFDEYEKEYADIAEWIPVDTIDGIELASTVDFRPFIKQAAQL
jgi:8-oxo-dGTP diphosphatase